MITGLLKKIFGSRNERLLKQYRRTVDLINAFEPQMQALSDEALRAKTAEFRVRIQKALITGPALGESDSAAAAASESLPVAGKRLWLTAAVRFETKFCQRPLRSFARPVGEFWECVILICSLSAVLRYIMAKLPRCVLARERPWWVHCQPI